MAIEYALKYQEHLKGLVISNMTAGFPSYVSYLSELRAAFPAEVRAVMEKYEAAGDYDAAEYQQVMYSHVYRKHVCRVEPWPEPLRRMFSHMSDQVYNTMQGPNEFVVTGNLKEWDRWEDLAEIEVPTLLSVGRYDTMRVADIELMGELMPNARVSICEQGSHCSMYDDQEAYFHALLSFIGEVEAGRFRAAEVASRA